MSPVRFGVMPPGEFVRHYLSENQLAYVGEIFKAFKAHLREGGKRHLPARTSFSRLIWLLRKAGAIRFVKAERIQEGAWSGLPERIPRTGLDLPSPRRYYEIVNPESPAFLEPELEYRRKVGLPVERPPRERVPVLEVPVEVEEAPAPAPRRRRRREAAAPAAPAAPVERRRVPVTERLKREANAFLPEIIALANDPERARQVVEFVQTRRGREGVTVLDQLAARMQEHFDTVLNALERATGPAREELRSLADTLETTESNFEDADRALDAGNDERFRDAMDRLSRCCAWPLA